MKKTTRVRSWHAGLAIAWFAGGSAVAGGHFDVDDADSLGPGECQYELWTTRGHGGFAGVVHAGPACRVGAVELGANVEQSSGADRRDRVLGPQVKWTVWGDSQSVVSVAVSASAFHDVNRHGEAGRQWVLPVTWRPADFLRIHVNAGRDWAAGDGARTRRQGIAAEWAASERFALIAERSGAADAWTSRLGVRFNVTPLVSFDVSAARTKPGALRSYAIGFNGQFSR